jgi:hypothetical protein
MSINKIPHSLISSRWKPSVFAAVATILGAVSCITLPLARAAATTPAETIQSYLPHPQTLTDASKDAVLSAICKAVSKNQSAAPEIVRIAAGARKEFTDDILKTVVNCLAEDKTHFDCKLAHSTLLQAIAVKGDQAASLTEAFIQLSPTCVEGLAQGLKAANNVANINTAPASMGGGGAGDSPGATCAICHNHRNIQVACSNVENYLSHHPGDTAGPCEATPASNR